MFWAYLWGIETTRRFCSRISWLCFEPTYEELKLLVTWGGPLPFWVLSLPMRNWNYMKAILNTQKCQSFEPTYEELKLPFQSSGRIYCFPSFEPTYEELKRCMMVGFVQSSWSFEPTYEELKPFVHHWQAPTTYSFEPTYEELKHSFYVWTGCFFIGF